MIDYSEYVGIPFRELGRDKGGVDCWGLIKLIFENEYKIVLPEYYISHHDEYNVTEKMTNVEDGWHEVSQPFEGVICLLTMHENDKSLLNHIGLFINNAKFIQATKTIGSFIVGKDHPYWSKKIKKLYTWNP